MRSSITRSKGMVVYKVMAGWRTAAPDPRRRYGTRDEPGAMYAMQYATVRDTFAVQRTQRESRQDEQEGGREGWWSAERGPTSLMTSGCRPPVSLAIHFWWPAYWASAAHAEPSKEEGSRQRGMDVPSPYPNWRAKVSCALLRS